MVRLFLSFKYSDVSLSGVDSTKWNIKKKVSSQARMRLSLASQEEDYEQREVVFEGHRPELCVEFR